MKKEIRQRIELEHTKKLNSINLQGFKQRRDQENQQVEKRQIIMNQKLAKEKGEIETEFQHRREALIQDSNTNNVTLTA